MTFVTYTQTNVPAVYLEFLQISIFRNKLLSPFQPYVTVSILFIA